MKKYRFERLKRQLKIHWHWLRGADWLTVYEFIEKTTVHYIKKCIKCGGEFETSNNKNKYCKRCQCENIIKLIKDEKCLIN